MPGIQVDYNRSTPQGGDQTRPTLDYGKYQVLAEMDGTSECLTVDYKTLSRPTLLRPLHWINVLFRRLTGSLNLDKVAGSIGELLNQRNLDQLQLDIQGMQGLQQQVENARQMLRVAHNLNAIAARKERASGSSAATEQLRAIAQAVEAKAEVFNYLISDAPTPVDRSRGQPVKGGMVDYGLQI
ncbi:MAG: hypothetical protein K2P51_08615 [Rhabdochlamydiaceae bacterium]|nr:hypothetical protein [Rhabdochlamydiaceae bacterium]